MNREEVILTLKRISELKPRYFSNIPKDDKYKKIDEWLACLKEYSFSSVISFVESYISEVNRVPDIELIIDNAKQIKEMDVIEKVEKYRCQDGRIRYGESLYNELSFDDWYKIPAEMMSRMEYDPSLNTPKQEAERQTLLVEALRLQALD